MLSIDKLEINSDLLSKFNNSFGSLDKYALAYSIILDNNIVGYIVLDRISQMNEYKLGKLYIKALDDCVYSAIDNEFDNLLENFINKEFYLKITIDIDKSDLFKTNFIKTHYFVLNKENENNNEYKITKPIYLERRK